MIKPCPQSRSTLLLLCAATAALLISCSDPDARETPGEKAEWTVLQGTELENRAIPTTEPVFKVESGYEVLGVRGLRGGNVWVLLKPSAPPYYKQMPSGNYEVPKELVDKLVSEHRLSYTVEQVLQSHVSAK